MPDTNKQSVPASVKAFLVVGAIVGGTFAVVNNRDRIKEAFHTASGVLHAVTSQLNEPYCKADKDPEESDEERVRSEKSENSFGEPLRHRHPRPEGHLRTMPIISDSDSNVTPSSSDDENEDGITTHPFLAALPLD